MSTESSLDFPHDPNSNKNRIPDKIELIKLRELAWDNERMIQEFNQKIEKRQSDCGAIQERYDQLINIVEGVLSELVATKRSVAILEDQKAIWQHDLDVLNGLMHPIRRCPSEILQQIFEWTVEISGHAWFKAATCLSHVCQRWREISLRTPLLWTYVIVSLDKDVDAVKLFWARTVERVKATPTTVLIQHIKGTEKQWRVMDEIQLDLIPHIEDLAFQLETSDGVTRLTLMRLQELSLARVDHLEIRHITGMQQSSVDLGSTISKFIAPSSVTISNIGFATFPSGPLALHITRLKVDRTTLSLYHLANALPSLIFVDFDEVRFNANHSGDIVLANLKQMVISTCVDVPWNSLRTTNITHLFLLGQVNDDVIDFISLHTSLISLDIPHAENRLHSIATSAPQITTLTTFPCEKICDNVNIKLCRLKHLLLYHDTALSVDLLERIIEARILSSDRTRNAQSDENIALTILVPPDVNKTADWRRSRLLSSATEEISVTTRWDCDYTSYYFTWN